MDRSDLQPEDLPYPTGDEGFRGVAWGSRRADMPWQWNDEGFGAPCAVRADEDLDFFGQRAESLAYTFRNAAFYGVRADLPAGADPAAVEKALQGAYPAAAATPRPGCRAWRTAGTAVYLDFSGETAVVCLWGRHRVFPDDSSLPLHIARPPRANSFAGPYRPRAYVCYRASGPIEVDGRLDEKAWRDAEWSPPFEDHQAPYAPPPWKTTRFKMLYDDEYLYFAAEMQEENVWGRLTERDSVIYYDNDFEIFLDATADGVGYYEFEINALNTVWDMFHETDYHRASALHSLYDVEGLRHAVSVQGTLNQHLDEDVGWTVEVAWPLKALLARNRRVSLPPRRGDVWRLNFSRVQYLHVHDRPYPAMPSESPCEDWVWQSTETGDLHNPEMWGKVVFSDLPAGTVKDTACEEAFPFVAPPTAPERAADDMVLLPGGTFTLGPDPSDAARSPAHPVELEPFWIDRYPVTVAQFAAFLNGGGRDEHYSTWMRLPERCGIERLGPGRYAVAGGRGEYPVVYVSYEAASAYAEAHGKSLPSEAQWERAARGAEGRTYAWGDEKPTPERANYDFRYGGTTPVGALPAGATPEGVFDLTGNVKEWTTSMFESYPGGEEMVYLGMREPFIYEKPSVFRVVRGGAWTKQAGCMAAAYRDAHGSLNLGFRCIRAQV